MAASKARSHTISLRWCGTDGTVEAAMSRIFAGISTRGRRSPGGAVGEQAQRPRPGRVSLRSTTAASGHRDRAGRAARLRAR